MVKKEKYIRGINKGRYAIPIKTLNPVKQEEKKERVKRYSKAVFIQCR